jgi:neutral ceramidase
MKNSRGSVRLGSRPVLTAGFAHAEITPDPGTAKIGNLSFHVGERADGQLMARVALLDDGRTRLIIAGLDALSIGATLTARIRAALPGAHVMVAATHTHGSGALVSCGVVEADPSYQDRVATAVVTAASEATERLRPAELATGRVMETTLAHNRRVVQRDGTVRTHGTLDDPQALWIEGPTDPELTVLAIRDRKHRSLLGCLVNYTLHPTHHGDDDVFSAGWPGVLAARLRASGVPETVFLNGALGDIDTLDPSRGGSKPSMHHVGTKLADKVTQLLPSLAYRHDITLDARSARTHLPYRALEEAPPPGEQRFGDDELYDRMIAAVAAEAAAQATQPAEVQGLRIGDHLLVGIPAELFVRLGLAIKHAAYPSRALVVGLANGMVGYLPTREAFDRGGFETTVSAVSKLAPGAGEQLITAAQDVYPGPAWRLD